MTFHEWLENHDRVNGLAICRYVYAGDDRDNYPRHEWREISPEETAEIIAAWEREKS